MGGKLARWIFQRLIKVKWASLVNLISGKLVVKEFLADEFTSENLERELYLILRDEEYRNEMLKNYAEMQKILGETGASRRTAEEIYKRIQHS
jgi:lipid-A-disaccharide synthase